MKGLQCPLKKLSYNWTLLRSKLYILDLKSWKKFALDFLPRVDLSDFRQILTFYLGTKIKFDTKQNMFSRSRILNNIFRKSFWIVIFMEKNPLFVFFDLLDPNFFDNVFNISHLGIFLNWVSKCDKRRRWSPHFKMTKMIAILFCEENSFRHSLDPSNYAWNPWRSCRKLEEKSYKDFLLLMNLKP